MRKSTDDVKKHNNDIVKKNNDVDNKKIQKNTIKFVVDWKNENDKRLSLIFEKRLNLNLNLIILSKFELFSKKKYFLLKRKNMIDLNVVMYK